MLKCISATVDDKNGNCLRLKLCKPRDPEYTTDNCDEKNGEQGLLCQSNQDKQG